MYKITTHAVAAAAALLVAPMAAQAQGYLKLELGSASWDVGQSDVRDGSNISGSFDDSDTTFGAGVGYDISPGLFMEVLYRDLGEATFDGTSDGTGVFWFPGSIKAKIEATTLEAVLVPRIAVNDRWTIVSRFGLSMWDSEISLSDSWGTVVDEDDGTDLTYGLGAEYRASKDVSASVNWQKHPELADEFDVSTITAGLKFHF